MMRAGYVAGLLVWSLGCNRASAKNNGVPVVSASDTTVRGVVRVVGADPMTQVIVRPNDAGQGVGIAGALRPEVGSLEGVEVSVTGPAIANRPPSPPRAVDVQRYEILSVGGLPAHAGVLMPKGDAMWLAGSRDTLELIGPTPTALARLAGTKVYVAGQVVNGRLVVQAFGAIGPRSNSPR